MSFFVVFLMISHVASYSVDELWREWKARSDRCNRTACLIGLSREGDATKACDGCYWIDLALAYWLDQPLELLIQFLTHDFTGDLPPSAFEKQPTCQQPSWEWQTFFNGSFALDQLVADLNNIVNYTICYQMNSECRPPRVLHESILCDWPVWFTLLCALNMVNAFLVVVTLICSTMDRRPRRFDLAAPGNQWLHILSGMLLAVNLCVVASRGRMPDAFETVWYIAISALSFYQITSLYRDAHRMVGCEEAATHYCSAPAPE